MRSRRAGEFAARWWAGNLGIAGKLLDIVGAPAEWAYRAAIATRNAGFDHGLLPVHRAGVPVVSVGNLTVGGSGKTPVSAWLLSELKRRGRRPALLHGGYAPDEPALHRYWFPDVPVHAHRDRVSAATRAVAAGADVLVLDDGFQHRRLARDLDLLLVAAESWGRRMRLLPRGRWREPLAGAARATLIGVTRRTATAHDAERVAAELRQIAPEVPVVRLELRPAGWLLDGSAAPPPANAALAVAAVADDVAFFDNARAAGAVLCGTLSWRDHHDYAAADVQQILGEAGGNPIVTTEKDWVKLRGLLPSGRVWVLRQEVRWEPGEAEMQSALDRVMPG